MLILSFGEKRTIYLEKWNILAIDHDVDHGIVHEGVEEAQQHNEEEKEVEYPQSGVGAAISSSSLDSVVVVVFR